MSLARRRWISRVALIALAAAVVLPPIVRRVIVANSAWASRTAYRGYMSWKGARWETPNPASLQRTTVDCGVAVFLEALRSAGLEPPTHEQARTEVALSSVGVTLNALQAGLLREGLQSVRSDSSDRSLHRLPVIALLRFGHFVLIRRASRSLVRYFDPLLGEVTLPRSDFLDLWSGRGLRLTTIVAAPRGPPSALLDIGSGGVGVPAVHPQPKR